MESLKDFLKYLLQMGVLSLKMNVSNIVYYTIYFIEYNVFNITMTISSLLLLLIHRSTQRKIHSISLDSN